MMLRLLKNVQLSRYLSTAARAQPERNPAILYTGVSIVFLLSLIYISRDICKYICTRIVQFPKKSPFLCGSSLDSRIFSET